MLRRTAIDADSWARIVDLFVDALPITELGFTYSKLNREGNLPYHPADLFKLLLYGYRLPSLSRRSENWCETAAETAPQSLFYPMAATMVDMEPESGMISCFYVNYEYQKSSGEKALDCSLLIWRGRVIAGTLLCKHLERVWEFGLCVETCLPGFATGDSRQGCNNLLRRGAPDSYRDGIVAIPIAIGTKPGLPADRRKAGSATKHKHISATWRPIT